MTLRLVANATPEIPEEKKVNLAGGVDELVNKYQQAYLNAKTRGELSPRIAFKQNNRSAFLKSGTGKFGKGAYTKGAIFDRNNENMPKDYQHSTSPELILPLAKFTNQEEAEAAGYVGVKTGDDDYFIFDGTYRVAIKEPKPEGDHAGTYKDKFTGKEYTYRKDGRRWVIDGLKGKFRSKKDVFAHIDGLMPV